MDGMGAADVGDAGLGETEKSHLSLVDQLTDRAGHILHRHGRIDPVLIEEIDVIGAEPAQGTLDRRANTLGTAVPLAAEPFPLLDAKTKLGGDNHLAAPA